MDRVPVKTIGSVLASVVFVVGFLMTYFTVGDYEQAVVTSWGKVNRVEGPGLHFKVPIRDEAIHYRTDILEIKPKTGANIYTEDNQEVDVTFTLFYRIPADKIAYVYRNVQDYKSRLEAMTVDRLKAEMGKVNVSELAKHRGKIRDTIKATLAADAAVLGVDITDFQLTELTYTKSFRRTVEQAATAKATVETREQERIQAEKVALTARIRAEGEANAAREAAKGEADAIWFKAQADARAIKARGEAEAAAIKAQAEALQQNARLVELRKAEKWDGALPKQLLHGVVPFMEFKAPAEATQ